MSQPTDEHALWTLIKDIKFGMLTHPHTDGQLHSAPVTTHNKAGDEGLTLYFFISRKSEIASCIAKDGNVNVSYAHPGEDSYVSASGHAAIVEDQTKKNDLFTSFAKAWFPGGATDPDLALLQVSIGHAEYWDVKESEMVQLAKMAKAAITGRRLLQSRPFFQFLHLFQGLACCMSSGLSTPNQTLRRRCRRAHTNPRANARH
ncbi:MAG: pyridoxamine 5'-phosphate oxidase family protein [Polaromonas sp.]|jgi:general stress protein 26